MNCICKCFLSLLLITMIASKVAVPVMQLYKSSLHADIEQQDQKTSEENNAEKKDAETAKTEVAEFYSTHSLSPTQSFICSLYHSYFINLLPARYFAVPTPPPWSAC